MQSPITATIKYAMGKPVDGRYGPRCNVLALLPDGTETRLWGSPADLEGVRKGDRVPVVPDGKGGYKLQNPAPRLHPPAPAPSAPTPPPDKRAIAQWIEQQAKLYAFCRQQAIAALPPETPEPAIQAASSSLYIAASRKFDL